MVWTWLISPQDTDLKGKAGGSSGQGEHWHAGYGDITCFPMRCMEHSIHSGKSAKTAALTGYEETLDRLRWRGKR